MLAATPRSVSRFLPLLATAVLVGCDQPLEPATQSALGPQLSHQPGEVATASGSFLPVDGSGVRGSVAITDDGTSLVIEASATGLDPDNAEGYASLLYDKASAVQGPEACEPGRNVGFGTDHPLSLTLNQMIIAAGWAVDAEGDGELGPAGTLEYVPVDMVGTMSIRDLSVNGGIGPAAVVACAQITPH